MLHHLSICEVAARLNVSQREVADVLRLNLAPGIHIRHVDGYRRVNESDLKAIRKAVNRRRNDAPRKPKSNVTPASPSSMLLNHLAKLRSDHVQ
jgi:hypothetical protein